MATTVQSRWAVRLSALVVWALVAGSCVYWGLKVAPRASSMPLVPPARSPVPSDPAAVARLLGAAPAAATTNSATPVVSLASRFNLLGVVAARSRRGAALIAVDGKPARPYRVGSMIDEGLVLQAVEGRRAILGASANGPAVLTLELPAVKR